MREKQGYEATSVGVSLSHYASYLKPRHVRAGLSLPKPGQLPMLRYLGPGAAIVAEYSSHSFYYHLKHLPSGLCFLLC